MNLDPKLEEYILSVITPEDRLLSELYRNTYLKQVNGRMCSGHLQGSIISFISKLVVPHRILEIGTFTGYSAICLAKGLSNNGKLHTIEINDELELFAKNYFHKAGLDDVVIQHIGNSIDIIPTLDETFDLVFIDADKRNYLSDYKLIFPKVRIGGIIIADNTLWSGKVIENQNITDEQTIGIINFNEFVKNDNRVETVILPIRDGMTILRKIDN